AAFDEELQESADRHVGDRVEPVELDAMTSAQFFLELCFYGILLRREECADGVVDKVQGEPAVRSSIAETVQETECLHRFFKDAVASLRIGLAGTIRGKRCDDLDTMAGQKFRQVSLRGQQQHGKVAAIDDMPVETTDLFDQPTKVRIEFRGPA